MTLLLLIMFSFHDPKEVNVDGGTILHEEMGFSITYPKGWEVRNRPRGAVIGAARVPPRKALSLIAVQPKQPNQSEAEMIKGYKEDLSKQFESHEILAEERIKINGVDTLLFKLKGTAKGHTMVHLTHMISAYDHQFVIDFVAEVDEFDSKENEFKSIAQTVALKGPKFYSETQDFLEQLRSKTPNYETLESLLKQGARIEGFGHGKPSPLTYAVIQRDPKLVKWLLDKGADPEADKMLTMIATPTIKEILRLRMGHEKKKTKALKGEGGALKVEYVSNEAQLFTGILQARQEDVAEAIEKGADLNALEEGYKLAALPLVRKIIGEFEAFDLDPVDYRPIEKMLVEASKAKK